MRLQWLKGELAVCRLESSAPIPAWADRPPLRAATLTDQELSLVVAWEALPPQAARPAGLRVEGPWRAFRVAGTLPFDLIGVVASLTRPLAEAKIPVFVISTFDTDYVLVKSELSVAASVALRAAGHELSPEA